MTWLMQDISTQNNFRDSNLIILDLILIGLRRFRYDALHDPLHLLLFTDKFFRLFNRDKTIVHKSQCMTASILYTCFCGKLDFLPSFIVNTY